MLYFFFGQDEWGMKQELRKIEAGFIDPSLGDLNIVRLDGTKLAAKNLATEMMTVGFLMPKKLIIIENLLKNKAGTEVDRIIEHLSKENVDVDIVIIENTPPDKRTSTFKKLVKISKAKEFVSPNPFDLVKRIEELALDGDSSITKEAAQLLSTMLPSDSLRLEQEVKKLSLFRMGSRIEKEDVESMVVAEVNSNVFDLVDNLARKNLDLSLQTLQKLIAAGINENYILTMITWQYRQLLIVRDLLDKKTATAQTSGINPYVFGKVLSAAKNYSFSRLKQIYSELEKTDYLIKTGGQEPKLSLELLAARLCRW